MKANKKESKKAEPNGIGWMLTTSWERAQAALRMQQQCPVGAGVQHSMVATDIDPYAEAYDLAHAESQPKPVPTFAELMSPHYQA